MPSPAVAIQYRCMPGSGITITQETKMSFSAHAVELNPARELSLLPGRLTRLLQTAVVARMWAQRKPKPRRHETYFERGTMAREMHRL